LQRLALAQFISQGALHELALGFGLRKPGISKLARCIKECDIAAAFGSAMGQVIERYRRQRRAEPY
jgi:hypothetical protein